MELIPTVSLLILREGHNNSSISMVTGALAGVLDIVCCKLTKTLKVVVYMADLLLIYDVYQKDSTVSELVDLGCGLYCIIELNY